MHYRVESPEIPIRYSYLFKSGQLYYFRETKYENIDDQLIELYSTEYALGEIKRRIHANNSLSFSRRCTTWIAKLEEHAMSLADIAINHLIEKFEFWLNFHTGSGFADDIMSWEDEGGSCIEDGNVILGGQFEYPIYDAFLKAFLESDPYFVDGWIEDMRNSYDPNDQEAFVVPDDKLNYVFDNIKDIYPNWQDLWQMVDSTSGNARYVLQSVIQTVVYPAWRNYWGAPLEVAESNVAAGLERLRQALNSQKLNEMLIAINVALQTEHIHGAMYDRADISRTTLDYLSNLPTDEIDQFVDQITGPNWKTK